jgi:hypothetical protein
MTRYLAHERRAAIEAAEASARRLFNRLFERIERPDGTFIIRNRRTKAVVGAGWLDRRPGREELL